MTQQPAIGTLPVAARDRRVLRVGASVVRPCCDVAALSVAGVVAYRATLETAVFVGGTLALVSAGGGYRLDLAPRPSDDVPRLLGCLAAPVVLLVLLAGAGEDGRRPVILVPAAAALVLLGRQTAAATLRALRRRGVLSETVLLVGRGAPAEQLADVLRSHPEYGLVPCGVVDGPGARGAGRLPLLGGLGDVPALVAAHQVRRLVLCSPVACDAELVSWVRAWRDLPVDLHVVPRLYELGVAGPASAVDDVWGIPLVRLRRGATSPVGRRAKRCSDVVVASSLLVVATPLLLGLAVAVRLSAGRPVLLRQTRVVGAGRTARVLKFRSVPGAERPETDWHVAPDACTRVGRLLRSTHLDELPQLVNVLRGDMSLVGPRPERPHFTRQFAGTVPGYGDRLRVPGGMTGWAQVHGLNGDTSVPERVRFDNHYIERWSPWLDLVVLVRTLATVIPRPRRDHDDG